jgi:polyphenol oxidase
MNNPNNPNPVIPRSLARAGVICGFTTRSGGASPSPFDSLNLGTGTTDSPEAVRENYHILYNFLSIREEQAALMHQVHSATVRVVERGGIYTGADGILTVTPGVLLGVRTADCVPVLLYDPRQHAAGAIHCGWRPIAGDILERALETMRSEWNSRPEDILAALGPSAGPCCYEIGEDVSARLAPSSVSYRNGRLYADLHAEIISRLRNAGMAKERIETIPHCTICNHALYFSHRRDGVLSGRMMGYIFLKP